MSTISTSSGVANIKTKRVSCAPDILTFDAPVPDVLADPAFDYREAVTIAHNAVTFAGRIKSIPSYGSDTTETINYQAEGPWSYLENIIYQQAWSGWDTGSEAVGTVTKPRVILCQDADGEAISNGAQITAAIQYAITKGAPIALGTISPALMLPWDEQVCISVAEVIVKMLRYSPDCACYFDYSTATPTFHCVNRTAAPSLTIPIVNTDVAEFTITPRYDLQYTGLTILIERTHESDGTSYQTLETQTAGTTSDPEAKVILIEPAGSRIAYMTQAVETETWPTNLTTDKAWWKTHYPAIAAIPDADITITAATRTGTLPRIATSGGAQDWMSETFEEDTVTASIKIITRDAAAAAVREEKLIPVKLKLTSTDATTKTYRSLASGEFEEPVPANLAADMYAAYSRLQYEGSITLRQAECTTTVAPGYSLNLTGGRTAWATMNAIVQTVTQKADTGETIIEFGPARQLGADDHRQILQAFRRRTPSYSYKARTTGKTDDAGAAINLGAGAAGGAALTHAGGQLTKLHIKATDSGPRIELDPAQVTTKSQILTIEEDSGIKVLKVGWGRFY